MDPEFLHQLAQTSITTHGNNTAKIIDSIVTNLTETYGSRYINPRQDEWVLNNAGGAMGTSRVANSSLSHLTHTIDIVTDVFLDRGMCTGAMYVIHASITEYLIIFGTPLGTEGHTGRHTADDYFNILVGEQWAARPGALEMEVRGTDHPNFSIGGKCRHLLCADERMLLPIPPLRGPGCPVDPSMANHALLDLLQHYGTA